ncbi:hypothetical protein [Priestia endophytica]|uniref:hypothetical protein n=1 Tax=Priestia endophytica TaxID=135735 RepID=UPI000DCA6159|nr:hypothetical protein [Priestia endophytica]RAS86423.1 hypothetical protein A4U60_07975 [Priestia endophytica]
MKLKRISMGLFALACTFIIPNAVNAADMITTGAGEWDYIDSDIFSHESKIFPSGGGDIKICLSSSPSEGYYYLYEEDSFASDDYIGKVYLKDMFDCKVFNVHGYVDGNNNQAEIYVSKSPNDGQTAKIDFYD